MSYNDIFGPEGLTYSESIYFLYKTKVASLEEKWNALEQAEKTRPPEFSSYFKRHKMDDLFNHLLIKRSIDAGYGDKPYYNNVSESLNVVIKRWQGFNMSQIDLFIKNMKELVMKQKSDVELAFLGLPGPYKVKPQFSGRVVPFTDFVKKTPAEKQKLKRSFHSVAVCSKTLRKVQDFKPKRQAKSVQQRNFSQEEEISEERFSALKGYLTAAELAGIVGKVRKFLAENGVREGFGDNFLVKSFSQEQPHIVFKRANGGYVCDTKCIGFSSNKLCAHLLAVAVKQCSLDSFFSWFLQKYDPQANRNLTLLTVNNLPKNAGKKGPTRQRERKPKSLVHDTGADCSTDDMPEPVAGFRSQMVGAARIKINRVPQANVSRQYFDMCRLFWSADVSSTALNSTADLF